MVETRIQPRHAHWMSAQRDVTFSIGEVFDPANEVARWLTVLAMASNDFWRFFHWMEEAQDDATRILAYRLEAAALFEAARHLTKPPKQWPKIATFIAALPEEARVDRDRVCGAINPTSEYYVGDWLERLRHVTFHYADGAPAKSRAKKEEIEHALTRAIAQGIEGRIKIASDSFGDVRFAFADEVAVQWLPDTNSEDGITQLRSLSDVGIALAQFAQRAIGAHLATLPEGVVLGMPAATNDRPRAA